MLTKRVLFIIKVVCTIHSKEISIRHFEGPMPYVPPLVYKIATGICPVNDGCEPEYYEFQVVGTPKVSE